MIPRYSPTYTYKDLFESWRLSANHEEVASRLSSRLAEIYQVKHVMLTQTARVALYAILKAYDRPGGVLLPSYNCIVVPEAISFAGYRPAFADIDYGSLSLTAERIDEAVTPGITAVLVTHLFGIPCDVTPIVNALRKKDVLIIEDAAPALGAQFAGELVGKFGDAAIVSFQATKVISAETGGALLTDNDELAEKVRKILVDAIWPGGRLAGLVKTLGRRVITDPRVYGATQSAYRLLRNEDMFEIVPAEEKMPPGFLAHSSSFDSALTLVQLDRLVWNVNRRREIAQMYTGALSGHPKLTLPCIPRDSQPAWIQFPLIVEDKWAFYKHMQRHHIDIAWTYRYSCADSYGLQGYNNAQLAAKTVVGLPTYPILSDRQIQEICNAAKSYPGM
jgi:perosamine synthetase